MSNPITLGHPEAHEKLTARLYWREVGSSGFVDAGNVLDYVDASSRTTVIRSRSEDGARTVNDEQVGIAQESYVFTLDERCPEQERLVRLAKRTDSQQQLNGEGATATLENIGLGKWHDIGSYNISNVQASGESAGPLTEGDDYQCDSANGRFLALSSGRLAEGETVDLEFDQPAFVAQKQTSQVQPLFYCDLVVEERNQYSLTWLRRLEFRSVLNVSEFPSHTGAFAAYKVKATATGPVSVEKRPEAPLPTFRETGVPGESSSQSSKSSSSESTHSSQSSFSSGSSGSSNSSSSISSASSASSNSSSSNSSSSSTVLSVTSSSSSSSSITENRSYSSMSSPSSENLSDG